MKYDHVVEAKFIERENRFVARVDVNGVENRTHVRNTGRCKELLLPGATVYLEDHFDKMKGEGERSSRKYRYSLIAVEKATRAEADPAKATHAEAPLPLLINMDSQAPNKVVGEALEKGELDLCAEIAENAGQSQVCGDACGAQNRLDADRPSDMGVEIVTIRPEKTFGNSRFDFYVEYRSIESVEYRSIEPAKCPGDESGSTRNSPGDPVWEEGELHRAFIEVKGVTLEEDGIARFPDAPTERGIKHIRELEQAVSEGYEAYILFVIQMKGMRHFEPNDVTHPQFGEALRHARDAGVRILAFDCMVAADSLELDRQVPVILEGSVPI